MFTYTDNLIVYRGFGNKYLIKEIDKSIANKLIFLFIKDNKIEYVTKVFGGIYISSMDKTIKCDYKIVNNILYIYQKDNSYMFIDDIPIPVISDHIGLLSNGCMFTIDYLEKYRLNSVELLTVINDKIFYKVDNNYWAFDIANEQHCFLFTVEIEVVLFGPVGNKIGYEITPFAMKDNNVEILDTSSC